MCVSPSRAHTPELLLLHSSGTHSTVQATREYSPTAHHSPAKARTVRRRLCAACDRAACCMLCADRARRAASHASQLVGIRAHREPKRRTSSARTDVRTSRSESAAVRYTRCHAMRRVGHVPCAVLYSRHSQRGRRGRRTCRRTRVRASACDGAALSPGRAHPTSAGRGTHASSALHTSTIE